MLKILQPRLQQYVKWELQMFKLDLENAEEPEIKLSKYVGSSKKQESSGKTSTFALFTTQNLWLCGSQQTVENSSGDGKPDHLTCLLRNPNTDQEATVRIRYGKMDWFQIGGEVHQGCIRSPCLFNLYAENIMWNVRMNEAQAGIKIAGRNTNILRYADDTTLMAKGEEELKSLLMKVK